MIEVRKMKQRKIDKLLLKNGHIIDPGLGMDLICDVLVVDKKIVRIEQNIAADDAHTIDMTGLLITPGLFDMHVHFREPGREDEETIKSGCLAAAAAGFTGVCPMPDTQPAADTRSIIEFIISEAASSAVDVYPIGAVTKGRRGEELTEMAEMVEAGAVAFSDAGRSIRHADMVRRSMEYMSMFNVPLIAHCEDVALAAGGAMHEGAVSTRLGLPGMPGVAESIIVARDILLAEFTKSQLHIAHISTARSLDIIRKAKQRGIHVTCDVTPFHLCLTDDSIKTYDANFKVNPPLRAESDRLALVEGLRDGTIDVIASDHAPHAPEEKDVEFGAAPFGAVGLETALGLILDRLVAPGHLSLPEALKKMSVAPRSILGLPSTPIEVGACANFSFIDTELKWQVDSKKFYSKCRNSPFNGWDLKGKARGIYNEGILCWTGEGTGR